MTEKQSLEVSVEFSPLGDPVGFALEKGVSERAATWLNERWRTLNTMSKSTTRIVMMQVFELKLAAEHVNGGAPGDDVDLTAHMG